VRDIGWRATRTTAGLVLDGALVRRISIRPGTCKYTIYYFGNRREKTFHILRLSRGLFSPYAKFSTKTAKAFLASIESKAKELGFEKVSVAANLAFVPHLVRNGYRFFEGSSITPIYEKRL